jgi:tetratricopeptide (TPR) repeat protein
VNNLLIGLLGALMATNQPAAISNLVYKQTGASVEIADPNDPVEQEFIKVMEADDAAQEEVDTWIRNNNEFAKQGAGTPDAELNQRILKRFDSVRKAYDDFIQRHPKHARAHIAYASFLGDIGDEEGSYKQLDLARELDPRNPAVWNNLANYYGHYGEPKKAFEYYAKAIELNPNEPIYYENFGTTVFLFRVDAKEFYGINEQQVFDKALDLYSHARTLNPDSFVLATFVAQTYYGIKPMRTNDALQAWTNALNVAHNEVEREGTYVHLARTKMLAGRYDEAMTDINLVTNENYTALKERVTRAIQQKITDAGQTNAPAADGEEQ